MSKEGETFEQPTLIISDKALKEVGDEALPPPYARPSPINWQFTLGICYYPEDAVGHNRICVAMHDPAFCKMLSDKMNVILNDEMRRYTADPANFSGWLSGTMK